MSRLELLSENAKRIASRPDKLSWSDKRGYLSQLADSPKFSPSLVGRHLIKLNPNRRLRRWKATCVRKYYELLDKGLDDAAQRFGKRKGLISEAA